LELQSDAVICTTDEDGQPAARRRASAEQSDFRLGRDEIAECAPIR